MLSSQNTMLSASSLIGLRATLSMAGLLSSTPPPSLGLGDTHFSDYPWVPCAHSCAGSSSSAFSIDIGSTHLPLVIWLAVSLMISLACTTLFTISILMIPKSVTLAQISWKNSRSIKPTSYWTPPSEGPTDTDIQTRHVRRWTSYPQGQPTSKSWFSSCAFY